MVLNCTFWSYRYYLPIREEKRAHENGELYTCIACGLQVYLILVRRRNFVVFPLKNLMVLKCAQTSTHCTQFLPYFINLSLKIHPFCFTISFHLSSPSYPRKQKNVKYLKESISLLKLEESLKFFKIKSCHTFQFCTSLVALNLIRLCKQRNTKCTVIRYWSKCNCSDFNVGSCALFFFPLRGMWLEFFSVWLSIVGSRFMWKILGAVQEPVQLQESPYLMHPVENDTVGLYKDPVCILDFASLYPSLFRAYNMSYDTLLVSRKDGKSLAENEIFTSPTGLRKPCKLEDTMFICILVCNSWLVQKANFIGTWDKLPNMSEVFDVGFKIVHPDKFHCVF